ncbi:hypothetical protein H0H92_014933 [Tricholoma furcatifolium]|nr:hypothetical protein H0H92_014933 [Tricholoma furcatifolium]
MSGIIVENSLAQREDCLASKDKPFHPSVAKEVSTYMVDDNPRREPINDLTSPYAIVQDDNDKCQPWAQTTSTALGLVEDDSCQRNNVDTGPTKGECGLSKIPLYTEPEVAQDGRPPQKETKKLRIFESRPKLRDRRPSDRFMNDPRDTDIIIPSFINILLGEDIAAVGHTLNSHTDQIQHVSYPHPHCDGSRVIVIDTPGFDHTTVDDREILRRIAVWLAQSYDANMKLGGIIYLHEISQSNMPPVRRNLETFNKLCGPSAIKHVVLATTKWGDVMENVGEEREKLLKDLHWRDMLDRGSVMLRFDGTQASAQGIVDQILTQEPLDAVLIQKELIDFNKILAETDAGRSLYCSLSELLETHKKTAASLSGRQDVHPELHRRFLETDHKIRAVMLQIKRLNHPSLSKRVKQWLGIRSKDKS